MGVEQQDHDLVFIGYFETIAWACALDEMLPKIDSMYRERRDADEDCQILRGLRWARNHECTDW